MKILNKKIDIICSACFVAAFSIAIASCSDNDKLERRSLTGFSVEYPHSWTLDTTGAKSIDTDIGRIITDDNDTIVYEYGRGIYRIIELPKTIFPIDQKRYLDSVGLTSEVILSNTPQEDISLNIHSKEYYLKDTIDNKEVIWVFPKKFRKGKIGAYFFNPKGKNLSIYSDAIREETVDDFVEVVKSIKFNRD